MEILGFIFACFLALLFIQALLGIVSNYLSFSFMRKKSINSSVADKLTMILNATDLTVCLLGTIVFFPLIAQVIILLSGVGLKYAEKIRNLSWIMEYLFSISVICTAMSTCLISVIRAIVISNPFYIVKKKMVYTAVLISYIVSVLINSAHVPGKMSRESVIALQYMFAVLLGCIIFIVLVSSIICTYHLRRDSFSSPNADNNKHATVTILMISAIFCTINIIYLASCCYFGIILEIKIIQVYIGVSLIPINSILNPVVFLRRKKGMREYAKKTFAGRLFFKFTRYCCCCCCCCCYFCCCRKSSIEPAQTSHTTNIEAVELQNVDLERK